LYVYTKTRPHFIQITGNIPKWKSVLTIYFTASVAPEHQRGVVLQELFGVARVEDSFYFPPHVVDRFIASVGKQSSKHPDGLFIAIDPASHESSRMGLAAITVLKNQITVVGIASVPAKRCAVIEIQVIVAEFIANVKKIVPLTPIVFIIECNNSSVYASSILSAARRAATTYPVLNPFTTDNFPSEITPNVGPWTTHMNKYAAVEATLVVMLDRSIDIHPNCQTVGTTAVDPHAAPTTLASSLQILGGELKRIADDGRKIGGKASGLEDDVAMALMLVVYWHKVIKLKAARNPIQFYV
jgi:hypothetical protein